MIAKKRISRKIWIVLAVIFVLVVQALCDPLSTLVNFSESVQARVGLPYAQRRWEAQGITHYKFDIHGAVPLECGFGGNVEVKDGEIVRTGPGSDTRETFLLDAGFADPIDPYNPLCSFRNYTVPGLFDELERWLQKWPFSVTEISFDPKYGFISRFGFGSAGGHGLLSPIISDCCGGFRVDNFQALGK